VVSWGWVSWVGGQGGWPGAGMVAVVAGLGGGWWWRVACGVLGVGGLCGRGGVLCGRGGVLWWCPVWVATGWEWSAVRVACCVGWGWPLHFQLTARFILVILNKNLKYRRREAVMDWTLVPPLQKTREGIEVPAPGSGSGLDAAGVQAG